MLFFKKNQKWQSKHAIIGCGHIAPSHFDGCIKNNVQVTSCFDTNADKAKLFVKTYGIDNVANSYKEILLDRSIKSVSICTDHSSHAVLTIQALKAGKNVIVEKPMALSIRDAKKMIIVAKKYGKVLSVISQHRYNPLIIAIQKSINVGFLGKITLINASLSCHKEPEYYKLSDWRGTMNKEGGSALINQAIHTLDIILAIKGIPTKLSSFKSNLLFKKIIETEDTLVSIMQFKDRSLATLSCTNTTTGGWDSKVEVIGTNGKISFSVDYPVKILNFIHRDEKIQRILEKKFNSLTEKFSKPPAESYYGTKHREQMGDFFDVISGKSKKLFIKPDEALRTLTVVQNLYNP